MNLKDILSISGEGSLFKFIAQGKNAIIVENIETGKRVSVSGSTKVSALEEIAIFTTGEEIQLSKVMDIIWEKENGGETISHKAADADLKKKFGEILPDYDKERVYLSDMKKLFQWYNFLQKRNMLIKEEPVEAEKETESAEPSENPKKTSKAKAKEE
ncbi:MAG TPA: DUF5606 domain-containing protein [Bacteroidales bacterium]|nr:DUF5606 domain-containing protein [Bacteroidales bacterium]